MKCDVKTTTTQPDAVGDIQEVFIQCTRDRVGIFVTKLGRMGLCKPCHQFLTNREKVRSAERSAGLPADKLKAVPLRMRLGHIIMDERPKDLTDSLDSGS